MIAALLAFVLLELLRGISLSSNALIVDEASKASLDNYSQPLFTNNRKTIHDSDVAA